jgi:hypothetical protein
MHPFVNNLNPRQGFLRQWFVWGTRWKNNNQEEGKINIKIKNKKSLKASSWKSSEAWSLVRGFEVAQETRPSKNSPSKNCCHVGSHVLFSPIHA